MAEQMQKFINWTPSQFWPCGFVIFQKINQLKWNYFRCFWSNFQNWKWPFCGRWWAFKWSIKTIVISYDSYHMSHMTSDCSKCLYHLGNRIPIKHPFRHIWFSHQINWKCQTMIWRPRNKKRCNYTCNHFIHSPIPRIIAMLL